MKSRDTIILAVTLIIVLSIMTKCDTDRVRYNNNYCQYKDKKSAKYYWQKCKTNNHDK